MNSNAKQIETATRKFQKELNSGAVSLVLLALFAESRKALYGYEIARRLESRVDGDLPMNQGALYPVLRSMQKQELLISEVQPSVSGPPRRYYRITKTGRQVLKQWKATWRNTTQFVNSIIGDDHAGYAEVPRAKVPRSPRS
ncbi:MAG: PadR family transcriptional regulator [Planctomycetaceae bacterium]